MHAVVVGSDMNAQTKFETELRNFVAEKKIQDRVHFVNKTLTVAPYLASIDVLVQNSQVFFIARNYINYLVYDYTFVDLLMLSKNRMNYAYLVDISD